MGICNLNTAILPVQFSSSLNDGGRTAHGRLMLVGGEHVCDVDGNMGSRDSSSQTKNQIRRRIITFEEISQTRERNRQCASVHGCLGGGNPSGINLWWILWISIYRMRRRRGKFVRGAFACGAKYPSQERTILPAARTTLQQGGSILPAAQTIRTRR